MALGVTGLAITAATLTGCGGSGLNPGPGPEPCGSAAAPGSGAGCVPPVPSASASVPSAHGLVVCQPNADNTAIDLEVISPQNMKVEASTTIPAVPGVENMNVASGPNAPVACSPGPVSGYNQNVPMIGPEQFAARQRFNASFTKMAVIIQKPSSGTADAGYLTLATGKVTDLTSASASSFGSSSATARDALFDPTTGDLWYLTSNGVPYSVDAAGHATAHPVSYAASLRGSSADAPGYIALAPETGWVLSDTSTGLPNPPGTVAVGVATTDTGGQLQIWHQGSDLTAEADMLGQDQSKTIKIINVKGWPPGLPDSAQNPAPIAWLSDTQLIMMRASQFYLVTLGHGYRSAISGPRLLPSNNYTFIQAVLSPDHHILAFTVNKGGTTDYLYELALNQPGARPKQIAALGSTSSPWAMLDWR
jgi:hypothetical protein